VYKAALGLVDQDRGLSLRFPRFYKIREDKVRSLVWMFPTWLTPPYRSQGIEDALHPDEFAQMYRTQEAGPKKAAPAGDAGPSAVDGDAPESPVEEQKEDVFGDDGDEEA